ncbi:hypothetical protein ACWE42_21710 [Sutcliffiella cohnii]
MQVFINGFTRIKLEGIDLLRMQIGDVNYKNSNDFDEKVDPEIDVLIKDIKSENEINKLFDFMYSKERQGYFEYKEDIYYRDCNIVANTCSSEIFYRGKLPNSKLYVKITPLGNKKIQMKVLTNKSFIMESRSRFTKLGAIEDILNDILLFLSVYQGKIPMHCSAVQQLSDDKPVNCLFMGLPNTGKTTTAVKLSKKKNNKFIAEDIAFVDVDTMTIYSAIYTSNVDKSELPVVQGIDKLFLLAFKKSDNKIEKLDKNNAVKMLGNMNLYEFNWDKNLILKGLMITGYMNNLGMNQFDINKRYNESYERLLNEIDCYLISGNEREKWPEIVESC